MSLPDDKKKRKGLAASAITEAERVVSEQVPQDRRQEMLEYLKLFGYKPDRTIIQVHIAGFFNKKRTATGKEAEKKTGYCKEVRRNDVRNSWQDT